MFCKRYLTLASPYVIALLATTTYSQTLVPNPGNGPDIYLDWDDTADEPESPLDFEVTFTDENYPNIALKSGSLFWRIWSTDEDNVADGGLGDIGGISSPAPYDFEVKIAGGEPADRMMLFRGPTIDPVDPNDQGWAEYEAAFPSLKDAGFTHMGLQIFNPTNPVVPTRVAAVRDVGLPLAIIVSPGAEYLTRKDFFSTGDLQSNGLDEKYFNTPGFDRVAQVRPYRTWGHDSPRCRSGKSTLPLLPFAECQHDCIAMIFLVIRIF